MTLHNGNGNVNITTWCGNGNIGWGQYEIIHDTQITTVYNRLYIW